MNRPEEQNAFLAFQRGPTAEELAKALPDLGDHAATLLSELARDPTADRCDRALCQLAGVKELVTRLRGLVVREGTGDDQCQG